MEKFIFIILMGVPKELEEQFNHLYDTDHLLNMMKVPGNRRCDRYKLDWSDNPDMLEYLALYEIDDPELPRSAAWKQQAGLGAWPGEMRPKITQRRNGVFRQIAEHVSPDNRGDRTRDHIYFLQQAIPGDLDGTFNSLYDTDHIPLMLQTPGVASCRRYRLEWSESGDVPDYLAVYEIDAPETARSAAWKAQTGKGAWPTQIRPHFIERRNGAYSRIAEHLGAK